MSRLYLRCAFCDRQQADGLISGAAWGRLELPAGTVVAHPALKGTTLRACPNCVGQRDELAPGCSFARCRRTPNSPQAARLSRKPAPATAHALIPACSSRTNICDETRTRRADEHPARVRRHRRLEPRARSRRRSSRSSTSAKLVVTSVTPVAFGDGAEHGAGRRSLRRAESSDYASSGIEAELVEAIGDIASADRRGGARRTTSGLIVIGNDGSRARSSACSDTQCRSSVQRMAHCDVLDRSLGAATGSANGTSGRAQDA